MEGGEGGRGEGLGSETCRWACLLERMILDTPKAVGFGIPVSLPSAQVGSSFRHRVPAGAGADGGLRKGLGIMAFGWKCVRTVKGYLATYFETYTVRKKTPPNLEQA